MAQPSIYPGIYLDSNATTPVDPRVLEAMLPYFREIFGNASSKSHAFGWQAADAVESARASVAKALGAAAREIFFVSGATEANNLAILGLAAAEATSGGGRKPRRNHVVTQATEHHAVLDPCAHLAKLGFEVTVLRPDADGRVHPEDVRRAVTDRTLLVSIMTANNETGTLQPIAEIGSALRDTEVVFHTDAAQAAGKIPLDVNELGVDLLSLSAHKFYGPKGVGVLYARRGSPKLRLQPIQFGGGHESGLRPGTLNVPGIVGLAEALRIATAEMGAEAERLRRLRDRLEAKLVRLDGVRVNGHRTERLPNTLNVSFAGIDGTALLPSLPGLAVSSGAACSTGNQEASHVLKAMGVPEHLALATLRFGLGRFTTEEEVDRAAEQVIEAVQALRARGARTRYSSASGGRNPPEPRGGA